MSTSSVPVTASTVAPSSSTAAAATVTPHTQQPSASLALTGDAVVFASSAGASMTSIPTDYGQDLSRITLEYIKGVMSQKQWSGDSDDLFMKRLMDKDVKGSGALAVLVHYYNDAKTDLAGRIRDLSSSKLVRLCSAIGLVYAPSGKKKEDSVLLCKQITDFVLLHVNKYPSLVMSITTGSIRSKSNTSSQEEAKIEMSEHEETVSEEDESDSESGHRDEPVSNTPPPPSRTSSTSNVAAPRSSSRATKGVREFIPPPGSSKSTVHRKLDLPSSKSNKPSLSGDVLSAVAMLPEPKQDQFASTHKSKSSKSNQKKGTTARGVTVSAPSQSDATDSDSDGPGPLSHSSHDHIKEKKEGKKVKVKESKRKKQTHRSRSRSRSNRHRRHRRHRSVSTSSRDHSSSESDDSSSFSDSTSDLTTDSDSHSTKRHHRRSRSSRPLVVYTPSRHGDVDFVHDGITSLRLTQPLAKAFLNNVYRTSKSVYDAYEKIEFRQTRNQRECLVLARIIDLVERKRYSRALESLVRRLAGVHTSDSTGDWNYSDAYELDMSKQSFVPDDFAAYAAKSVGRMSTRDTKSKSTSDRRNVKLTSTRTSSDRNGSVNVSAASTSSRDPTTKSTSTKSNGKQRGESGSRKK